MKIIIACRNSIHYNMKCLSLLFFLLISVSGIRCQKGDEASPNDFYHDLTAIGWDEEFFITIQATVNRDSVYTIGMKSWRLWHEFLSAGFDTNSSETKTSANDAEFP